MAINHARRRRHLASLVAGSAVLSAALLCGGAAAANAATPSAATSDVNCSYDLGTETMVCVAPTQNLDDAVQQQTGLVVQTAPSQPARTRTAAAVTPNATYIQTILYEDQNLSGNYLQITNSNACNGSTVYRVGDLGASPFVFNNRTSSFHSYSGCTTKLWENTNFTGASVGYSTTLNYVGDAMNDRASSVQIR